MWYDSQAAEGLLRIGLFSPGESMVVLGDGGVRSAHAKGLAWEETTTTNT